MLLFHDVIKSEETEEEYDYCLKKFLEFQDERGFRTLVAKGWALQEVAEDHMIHLKKTLKTGSMV